MVPADMIVKGRAPGPAWRGPIIPGAPFPDELPMSTPDPRPRVGLFRRLLPTFAVAVGVIVLLVAWGAPGRDSDLVRLPLIAAVLVMFTLLLFRLLRPLRQGRKVVSLGL